MDAADEKVRRYHVFEKTLKAVIRRAGCREGITQPGSVQTLRLSFATHLFLKETDIREIQELLGHKSVETTRIYTPVVRGLKTKAYSRFEDVLWRLAADAST